MDLEILSWIRTLNETEAVGLARRLIFAEAGRLSLPRDLFGMSGRVKANDGGVDGRTHFPDGADCLLPTGRQVWQIKSGKETPSASAEFDLTKRAKLRQTIADGYDYVLFWTNDPTDQVATNVRSSFTEQLQSIRPDTKAVFYFGDSIQSLCHAHPGVLADSPVTPLRGGVFSLAKWGGKEDFNIPYQTDVRRSEIISIIRKHASSESGSPTLALYGDTGVGKSRTAYEALSTEGFRERTVVALGFQALDLSIFSFISQSDDRRLILIVDDCTPEERRILANYAGTARGRIRLVAIGSRYSRDPLPPDSRYIELGPLETAACREIALAAGVEPDQADQIAELTEGYPKLAFVLAVAVREGGPNASLTERLRGEEIGIVLASMITDPKDVALLGILAIFERLGFDAEMSAETAAVCEAFGINERAFRRLVDRETRRFVSEAGRFRLVTPRLFAIWLATEYIRRKDDLGEALGRLPPNLHDRVIGQMKEFAGDFHVASVLADLTTAPPFSTGALADVGEGSGRLIHVAAIVDPALGMQAVESLLDDHTTADLMTLLRDGRRGIVEALEVLAWFPETFERAAFALLRLAIAENETWANNASGVLKGLFHVHLGGTSVAFERRAEWARSAISSVPDSAAMMAASLSSALDIHEMRSNISFGTRSVPEEWHPENANQEIVARRLAWKMLMNLANFEGAREAVGAEIATKLRSAAGRGLLNEIISDLPTVDWAPIHRVQMNESLGHLIEYGELQEQLVTQVQEVRSQLIGSSFTARLRYLLNVPPWLFDGHDPENDPRPLLAGVVAELVASGELACALAAQESLSGNEITASVLFEQIAIQSETWALLVALEAMRPVPEGAIVGFVRGLSFSRNEDQLLEILRGWLDTIHGSLVVRAAHVLTPSISLAEVSVEAVLKGYAAPRELGRFLYGLWTTDLPESVVARLVGVLSTGDGVYEREHALGIIAHWSGANPDAEMDHLAQVAMKLLSELDPIADQRSSMISLYREEILNRITLPAASKLEAFTRILSAPRSRLEPHDLVVIDKLSQEEPRLVLQTLLDTILTDDAAEDSVRAIWLSSSKLLSRTARNASRDTVEECLLAVPMDRWRELVAHVSFSGTGPDWVAEFLLNRTNDDVVGARLAFAFMYPESAWWGPESEYLAKRMAYIELWKERSVLATTVDWLTEVEVELATRIAIARTRDQEA